MNGTVAMRLRFQPIQYPSVADFDIQKYGMVNKSYQVFYPCFSTNKNCLTEASYIPLEGSEKKVFKTDGFNLQNGEI